MQTKSINGTNVTSAGPKRHQKTKLVKITLTNRTGDSITRSVKTSGSAAKAARSVAYEIHGYEIVDYVVIS